MQLTITGKNIEISNWLNEYVEKKVSRLDRYLPVISEVRMELSVENTRAAKDSQVAQVTLRTKHAILRAEEASADMFVSIDQALDKMQRQIDHYKGKRWTKRGAVEGAEGAEEAEAAEPGGDETGENVSRISRVKQFAMVPMDEEEAVDQMELLGHDFYVFFNVNQNAVNVVYRRKSGGFGLIQPELA
jgi:putative sigma-54 modulation protein